jgi:hypothetical protein
VSALTHSPQRPPAAPPLVASPLVRERVEDLLSRSKSYRQLPEDRRQDLSDDMVKVAQFIVGGPSGHNVPRTATLVGAPPAASALAAPLRSIADPAGQTAGSRFAQGGAAAARQGTAAYTGMIRDVNFPAFVAGLIDGVFNAIVTSSIKQMDAYAELVKNVAKSVDDFMKDNISENSARGYLANRYPDHLQMDTTGDSPVLKPKEGADDSSLPDFFKDLGLAQPVSSLDQDTAEQVLMPAARQRMAMDRQQLLATMVLMGINRLVVTDGNIQASCTFTLDTRDSVNRHYDSVSETDRDSSYSEKGQLWYNPNATYDAANTAHFTVSTHQSEDSAAQTALHAQLGGKVQVNFRSDVFPLEKMADVLQINQIQQNAPAGVQAQLSAGSAAPGAIPATGPAASPTAPPAAPVTFSPAAPQAGGR